jgi:hypothetical protein
VSALLLPLLLLLGGQGEGSPAIKLAVQPTVARPQDTLTFTVWVDPHPESKEVCVLALNITHGGESLDCRPHVGVGKYAYQDYEVFVWRRLQAGSWRVWASVEREGGARLVSTPRSFTVLAWDEVCDSGGKPCK